MEGKQVKHRVEMTNRCKVYVEGVLHVDNFDEEEITFNTTMGLLQLKGEGLHIVQLNLEEGTLIVEGMVSGMTYSDERSGKSIKSKGKHIIDKILR